MSDLITERDRQVGIEQAWHGKTIVVDQVTREASMPFEVVEHTVCYKVPGKVIPGTTIESTGETSPDTKLDDVIIESPEFAQLLASDDMLPVGDPYNKTTYRPSTIATFWDIIEAGLKDTKFEIISAGTVDNRQKVFASLKFTEGFVAGGRKFEDFITLIDSYDKSTCLQARYSNVCVVCANTFQAVMGAGASIGKAKHTASIDVGIARLIDAMKLFSEYSTKYQQKLQKAADEACSRDEARAWIAGIVGSGQNKLSPGNQMKISRIVDLFDSGMGNEGKNRLDAFSAFTEFHTHESSNRKGDSSQYATSEWGASAILKTQIATTLSENWLKYVHNGEKLLLHSKREAQTE